VPFAKVTIGVEISVTSWLSRLAAQPSFAMCIVFTSVAVTDGSYGANGASGCVIWMNPSLQLMRIYLTHYFLGDFREGNMVMNAAFPG
jgi:hypothetical protein